MIGDIVIGVAFVAILALLLYFMGFPFKKNKDK